MMVVDLKDVTTVLFALHLAKEQGAKLDHDGSRTRALWDAVLPISLPEPTDPPITATWRALVKVSEAYAQLADQPSGPRPPTIRDEGDAQASGLKGTA
jgi:hypothetical protein